MPPSKPPSKRPERRIAHKGPIARKQKTGNFERRIQTSEQLAAKKVRVLPLKLKKGANALKASQLINDLARNAKIRVNQPSPDQITFFQGNDKKIYVGIRHLAKGPKSNEYSKEVVFAEIQNPVFISDIKQLFST